MMTTRMTCLRPRVTVAFLSVLLSPVSLHADSVDVFPLNSGFEYIYQYRGEYYSWAQSTDNSRVDSGTVSCLVRDSSVVNDTTLRWTIVEIRHVLTRRWATLPTVDTTYLIDDSTVTNLYECTRGYHALISTSLAWNSPSWYPSSDSVPVYRFAGQSPEFSAISGGFCMVLPSNFDSLWQSSDSGLYRRTYSRCFDYDQYGSRERHTFSLLSLTVLDVAETEEMPGLARLLPNYPNPFNTTTTIRYVVPAAAHVTLRIYDLLGREVKTLIDQRQDAGLEVAVWNSTTNLGYVVGSGVYLCRLQVGDRPVSRKLLLLK